MGTKGQRKHHLLEKRSIKWAASLHGKLVQVNPPEFPHTFSEFHLTSIGTSIGLAFAVRLGKSAILKIFVMPGELRDIRWHLRKYIQEASEEEVVMARLRSELPDISMMDQGQIILCSVPKEEKELRKAIEKEGKCLTSMLH